MLSKVCFSAIINRLILFMGYDDFPELYEQYAPDPSADGGDVDPEWALKSNVAGEVQDFVEGQVEGEIEGVVRNVVLSRRVGYAMKLSAAALGEAKVALFAAASREFTSKLGRLCGRRALMALFQTAGFLKMTASTGGSLIDGPLPIADMLTVYFAGETMIDVANLANIMWQGYRLHEEMDVRLAGEVADLEVLGPEDLVVECQRHQVLEGEFDNDFVQSLMNTKNVNMRIKRKGMGWEHWKFKGDGMDVTFYDEAGARVAGITTEELQEVEQAYVEIEARKRRDVDTIYRSLSDGERSSDEFA
jgi:hypothetical protein